MEKQKHRRRTKDNRFRTAGRFVLLIILLVCSPLISRAQQEQTPTPGQEPSSGASDSSAQDQNQEPMPDQTSTLDTSQPMGESNRAIPLRWGHLSELSVDTFYAYDTNPAFASNSSQGSNEVAARLIAEYTVGDEHQSLDVQWRPFTVIAQNLQEANFLTSYVDFHMFRHLGERWTFNFHEILDYAPDASLFINPNLTTSFSAGEITQSPLNSGATQLRNVASAILSHHLARHDTIALHGQSEYIDLMNGVNQAPSALTGTYGSQVTLGGGVSWTHTFSQSHEFGISANYDQQIFGNIQTQYYTLVGNYRQKIRPSVVVQLIGGPSYQQRGNGQPNRTTYVGTASLIKAFRDGNLALIYSRSYNYTGIITNAYHDRYDAAYVKNFGHTWGIGLGIAYFQTTGVGGTNKQFEDRAADARVNYYLNKHWTLFGSYLNTALGGDAVPLQGRNFFMIGARWSYGTDKELRH